MGIQLIRSIMDAKNGLQKRGSIACMSCDCMKEIWNDSLPVQEDEAATISQQDEAWIEEIEGIDTKERKLDDHE